MVEKTGFFLGFLLFWDMGWSSWAFFCVDHRGLAVKKKTVDGHCTFDGPFDP